MSWDVLLNYTVKALLLPPGINILLVLIALPLIKRLRPLAVGLLALSFGTLLFFSLPIVANSLMQTNQGYRALSNDEILSASNHPENKAAIVILAGGRTQRAPEYDYIDTVSALTLERLRFGAYLHRKTQLPILLSGGRVFDEATPEAVLMNQSLMDDFKIQPKWIEGESRNTQENATNSLVLLKAQGIETVYLVTHAWHMPRAMQSFENEAIKIIPAPTGFIRSVESDAGFLRYLPSAAALWTSRNALHEKMGKWWYSVRY